MRNERGMSLAEVTIVMVLVAIITTAVATYSIPWLGREEMRGAVYTIQEYLQLARVQAVSRNRDCRFLIDSGSRRVSVVDLNDPSTASDDISLYSATLSSRVTFVRPDTGSAVTLATGQNTVFDLAIDSTNVYWNDWGQQTPTMTNGSLMRVPIAGGTPTTIAAQLQAYDLVVDGTSLYATINFARPSHGTIVKITPK